MKMLKELAAELVGMFVGETRLTISLLAIVALVGSLVDFLGFDPLLGGTVLLLGSLTLLIESVLRRARSPGSWE
jgi:hypothetical protein